VAAAVAQTSARVAGATGAGGAAVSVNPALMSSARDSWCTPPEVLRRVRLLGEIGLDPCSNPQSEVGAHIEWSRENGEDGLSQPWTDYGLVFVNPPYGGKTSLTWTKKIADEARAGVEIVALLPARTDTRWFHLYGRKADALVFWEGRLTFLGAPTSAPFPSLLLYYGPRWITFLAVFADCGLGMRP
jgi:hypothetical protein